MKKINDRIDDKLVRRRQQQQQKTIEPAPVRPSTPPSNPPSRPLPNTTASSLDSNEYSIFRDLPVSRPVTTTVCLFIQLFSLNSLLLLVSTTTHNIS